jgi:hypothetical protein
MRELNVNEIKEVSGGLAFLVPLAMWAVKTTAVRVAAKILVGGASAAAGYLVVNSLTE